MTGWVKTQRHRGAYRFGASLLLALLSGCFGTKPSTNPTKISGVSEVSTVSSTTKPLFTEMSKAAGIDFEIKIQGKRPLNIRQTIGQGCAFLDYDRDGNLDILLIGNRIALYHGDGKGHFTETTHEMGLDALKSEFLGCAVARRGRRWLRRCLSQWIQCCRFAKKQRGQTFHRHHCELRLETSAVGNLLRLCRNPTGQRNSRSLCS